MVMNDFGDVSNVDDVPSTRGASERTLIPSFTTLVLQYVPRAVTTLGVSMTETLPYTTV